MALRGGERLLLSRGPLSNGSISGWARRRSRQTRTLHSVIYHIGCKPDAGHYRTLGVTAPAGEPSADFYNELQRKFNEGAAHPALHVQNDDTPTVLASSDLHEISRTWYIALFSRPQ